MRDWPRIIAGIVLGFSTPPLMVLIMVMTNQRKIMGDHQQARHQHPWLGNKQQW